MKNITITVSGKTASGKSRLTYLLKKFLREQGFDVNYECNIDFQNEHEFDKFMSKNIDNFIDNFKETKIITLKEVQTNAYINKHDDKEFLKVIS